MALFSIGFVGMTRIMAPLCEDRMSVMLKSMDKKETVGGSHESSGIRMDLWKTTRELIREQPLLGTGVGDVKDALVAG